MGQRLDLEENAPKAYHAITVPESTAHDSGAVPAEGLS